jgi:hypothetical protein
MVEKSTADYPPIEWVSLGEERWRELGQATGCSELQLRFAVLRFGGMSAGAAAKLSGYAGTNKSWRRVGYDAVRSTAVQNLLELAAVNAPEDARISDKEIDARIAKLVRSPDPNVSLKAVEAHAKRQAQRRELEASRDRDEVDPNVAIDWVFGLFRFEFDLLQRESLSWDDTFRATMRQMDATNPDASGRRVNGAAKPAATESEEAASAAI